MNQATLQKREGKPIRLPHVERKARTLNIKDTHRFSKPELIRMIQSREGNTACFGTMRKDCPETACCWRPDCMRK